MGKQKKIHNLAKETKTNIMKTKTCNFKVTILFAKGSRVEIGAENMKEVRTIMRSEKQHAKVLQYPRGFVVQAHIHPQTSIGKRMLHKHWAVMNPDGKVRHYYSVGIASKAKDFQII